MELERHHPVETCEPEGHGENDQKDDGETDVAARMVDTAIPILTARRPHDRCREADPSSEVHDRAHEKEGPSQPELLKALMRSNGSPGVCGRVAKKHHQ